VLPGQKDLCGVEFRNIVSEPVRRQEILAFNFKTLFFSSFFPFFFFLFFPKKEMQLPASLAEMVEHLTTPHVLQNQVHVLGVLEGAEKIDNEGALDFVEQPLFILGVVHLLHLDNLGLVEDLDRHKVPARLVKSQHHAPKRSCSQGIPDLKVSN